MAAEETLIKIVHWVFRKSAHFEQSRIRWAADLSHFGYTSAGLKAGLSYHAETSSDVELDSMNQFL
ncbi:predicted protein [Sclerotinia sclerotiorum 1980 UF-70]|uniref:Uncharacterized protein n=1 Tax=Sclerotinia sclerotiorum (strain ATCC 18683 / 1980 / Ss-1) TaxID=665079 RepID=A7F796_SCLS1|nr:predicted protein [Sclerotinia sclerotiorum 1980 UF-70]EDN98617.1 predicted protein [Sclerotinia sclerotiorum 1980 UF-70]